jgi:hypothetical protein
MIMFGRYQYRLIQVHDHELWDRIERSVQARVVQVESVFARVPPPFIHVIVDVMNILVGNVDVAVRVAHSRRRSGWRFDERAVAVNRETRRSSQEGEHFFRSEVEVLGWAASGLRLAKQREVTKVYVHFAGIDKGRAPVKALGAMGMAKWPGFQCRQGVSNAVRERPILRTYLSLRSDCLCLRSDWRCDYRRGRRARRFQKRPSRNIRTLHQILLRATSALVIKCTH